MADPTHGRDRFTGHIEANTDALYAVAFRLTRNGADAEDLVAESVAKAWTAFHLLADESRFRPWIFRILNNCFVSGYRKKLARPVEVSRDDCAADAEADGQEIASLLIEQPDDFLLWWANPEREFANRILREDIIQAIESLPDSFRDTVLLVSVEDLTYDEAAEVLGVSPGTVRSRMNRGRTLLQKALWQHARDAGLIPDGPQREQTT
jgi:RNA polymerase sigma-70 factor, ECF subfamily